MSEPSKRIYILAGPNGAGKTNLNPKLQKQAEGILAAMRRAKRRAEDLVIATGTKLVESKDGKTVLLGPDEILARRKRANSSGRV